MPDAGLSPAGEVDGAAGDFAAERTRTRDGVEYGIREISPSDRDGLAAFVSGLSESTKYRRFLHAIANLSEKELSTFTDLDHRDADALVAIDDRERLIGVARYVRDAGDPAVAEVAVTVADAWQGRGVGTALLRRLGAVADKGGIHRFAASCFNSNVEMINLFEELGTTRHTGSDSGVVELEIELPDLFAESLPSHGPDLPRRSP